LLKAQKIPILFQGTILMGEFSLAACPEVFVSDASISREVSRAHGQGRLRKLGSRLYTRNLTDPPDNTPSAAARPGAKGRPCVL
jgi:hypothetical protein